MIIWVDEAKVIHHLMEVVKGEVLIMKSIISPGVKEAMTISKVILEVAKEHNQVDLLSLGVKYTMEDLKNQETLQDKQNEALNKGIVWDNETKVVVQHHLMEVIKPGEVLVVKSLFSPGAKEAMVTSKVIL